MIHQHEIPYEKYLKLVFFDITKVYSNIPTKDVREIIDFIFNQDNFNEKLKHEIRKLSQVLIKQNYFQYHDIKYIQEESLAMVAPTSHISFEIYL
jgi:hypothetical protein